MTKRRVATPQEVAQAEQLRQAGFGNPNQPFDLNAEMAAQEAAGMAPVPPQQQQEQPPQQQEVAEEPESRDEESKEEATDPLEVFVEKCKLLHPNKRPPTVADIQAWKRVYGDIFVLDLEDRVLAYRYLNRQEYNQLLREERNVEPGAPEAVLALQDDERLFLKCVLWPKYQPQELAMLPANFCGLVAAQVRLRSYFLDPNYVSQFTFKL